MEAVVNLNVGMNPSELWENIKLEISSFSSKYSAEKAKKRRERLNNLNKELIKLIDKQCFSMEDTTLQQNNIQEEIEEIYESRVEAIMFRSKANWYSEVERNTKNFFRLEKQKYNAKVMSVLVRSDGTVSKNQKGILKMQAEYYQRLYTADMAVGFTFTNNTDKKLMDEEKIDVDRTSHSTNCILQ